MSRILLFSGGLDSFIMWRLLGEPDCLYVAISHRYQQKELETIRRLQQRYPELEVQINDRLNLSDRELPSGIIPLRNLFFAMIATEYADTVYYGALKGESSTDKSGRFIKTTTGLLKYLYQSSYWTSGRQIELVAPFRHLTKTGLVKLYIKRGHEVEELLETVSCYHSTQSHCGECMACFRRWVAMFNNGIQEEYSSPPWEWEGAKIRFGTFSIRDAWVTFPANLEAIRAIVKVRGWLW